MAVLCLCVLVLLSSPASPALGEPATLELIKPLSFSNAELRGKDFSHQDLRASDFANANLDSANFNQSDLRGAIFSASVMQHAQLEQAHLQHAMMDLVDFTQANLQNAILAETLLLRSTFVGADINGADFTDAILDGAQQKQLCQVAQGVNPETGIATRESLNCPA